MLDNDPSGGGVGGAAELDEDFAGVMAAGLEVEAAEVDAAH